MEVTIDDLKFFKLSPTYIIFLKCIHNNNQLFLEELNKTADCFLMAKHLEKNMIVKIIGDKLKIESFSIRRLDVIKHLKTKTESNSKYKNEIDEIITYFKKTTGQRGLEQALKSKSQREFISGRLREGYSVQDLKDVVSFMYKKWKDDYKMRNYIRISTLFNSEKFHGYVGMVDNVNLQKDFADDI